jgi:PAS domain S-box-containing protein
MIANLFDITDYKQVVESQKRIEERYHDLCENSNVMMQCITPAGQITYTNPAWRELMGYSPEEITNLSVFQIIPTDYRQYFHELIQRAISGESISDVEAVIISKKGARISVDGNINCRFLDNKPIYMRVVLHDVSKRKEKQMKAEALLLEACALNKKLEDSNRELEDFAHIASHDLQEPLRKISSFGSLLEESLKDRLDEDEAENLSFMTDGASRMQSMINALLAYSRITTRAKSFEAVDTNKVVDDLKNLELANMVEKTKGTLVVPKQLPVIKGDSSQIYQLFQNLISNGFKFHKEGMPTVVTINSHPVQGDMLLFYVRDNGIGIDSEYHDKVFTMFKRLHSREQYEGTGIGLAVCKKIVLRHGGEIGVKSKAGEGSDFWFTLPRFDGLKKTEEGGAGDNE